MYQGSLPFSIYQIHLDCSISPVAFWNSSLSVARNFTSEILTKTSHLSDFKHKSIQENHVRPEVHKAKSPNKLWVVVSMISISISG